MPVRISLRGLGFLVLAVVLAAAPGCPTEPAPPPPPEPLRPRVAFELPKGASPAGPASSAQEGARGEDEDEPADATPGAGQAPAPVALLPRDPAAPAAPPEETPVPAGEARLVGPEVLFPEIARLVPVPARVDRTEKVVRVTDGDTVRTESGLKVRLIGMNTPEMGMALAAEATAELRALVQGKQVQLVYDVEQRDMYKRTLAYLFCEGRFVNGELVRRGLAHYYRWEPNVRYAEPILELQRLARKDTLGLWSLAPPPPSSVYVTKAGEHVFHRPECAVARRYVAKQRIELPTREAAFDSGRKPDVQCNP